MLPCKKLLAIALTPLIYKAGRTQGDTHRVLIFIGGGTGGLHIRQGTLLTLESGSSMLTNEEKFETTARFGGGERGHSRFQTELSVTSI